MSSHLYIGGKSLNNPSLFEKINGHLYVTVFQVNLKIEYSIETKRDDELEALCASSVSTAPIGREWSLQLLITPKSYKYNVRRLPYSQKAIKALQRHWHIAEVCFHAHLKAGSCAMPYKPIPSHPTWKGFLLRVMYDLPFQCTLAISHDRNTQTTYGICYGGPSPNISLFLEKFQVAKEHAYQALLVSLILADMALTELETSNSRTFDDFIPVREATGCNLYFLRDGNFKAPDLSEMPASLLAIGVIIGQLDVQLEQEQLLSQNTMVVKMREHLILMREVVYGTTRRNNYLKESIQAQVQMVYALLAQQDNALNHRYGADMRIISAVTLLFLPGTFVATLFSATFWDFSPDNAGAKVSSRVWLYWIVALALTAAVACIWRDLPLLKQRKSSAKSIPSLSEQLCE
ncbi:hypothetical protein EK21DRAFT_111738 [Setomelanomma holmii]|uniref:Uncharacterized protein n=1 Tax=Setomelanomma holmii TaxID=210430 RepID=A0A9P4LMX5_9PLEO|nr:hypothetical protein EK21DRAFT_111738 [Setomelanomma holmii]